MRILHQHFELAYGKNAKGDYSQKFINDFSEWFHNVNTDNFIEFEDVDEIIYQQLDENDKEKVKDYILRYAEA